MTIAKNYQTIAKSLGIFGKPVEATSPRANGDQETASYQISQVIQSSRMLS
jgi:hypothetical protein